MINGRTVVRRVTKKTYDKYTVMDQGPLVDNLNPVKPTELESQLNEVKEAVRKKVVSAYAKANIEEPTDLSNPEISTGSLLNDINNLIDRVTGKGALSDWEDKIGGASANIYPFLSVTGDATLDNPLKLDCSGVLTDEDSDDIDSEDSNNNSDDDDDDNDGDGDGNTDDNGDSDGKGDAGSNAKEVKIEYKNLVTGENISGWPTTLLSTDFPYNFMNFIPSLSPTGQTFEGWYLDKNFQDKVFSKSYNNEEKITVYANFINEEDADGSYDDGNVPSFGGNSDDEGCDLVDLFWLKIVLIIIMVAGILIQVFVMIYNIQRTLSQILKDAQLCWINPPSLQSLISYVVQRLSAVLFQIIGMLIMKLWAMLDLDCVSDNVTNSLSEINDAMSALMNLLNEINALALGMGGGMGFGELIKTIVETIYRLKDEFLNQKKMLTDMFEKFPEQFGITIEDQKEIWTNPATYLAMVPPEVMGKVNGIMSSVNGIKSNIKNLQSSINNLIANFNGDEPEASNNTPNVTTITF